MVRFPCKRPHNIFAMKRRQKVTSSESIFFAATIHDQELSCMFELIRQRRGFSFAETLLEKVLQTQPTPTKSLKTTVNSFLLNGMWLFVGHARPRKKMVENLCC